MNLSTNTKVNDFLADIQSISPEQFDIIISIRKLFLNANKTITEDIKYGGVVFNVSNALVGGIYIYKQHISIEFSNGADFIDTESILEGGGKRRRHLKIYTDNDIVQKSSLYFINQAVSI